MLLRLGLRLLWGDEDASLLCWGDLTEGDARASAVKGGVWTVGCWMAGMLWDVHLEGPGYEEKRLEEVGRYRKAFIARRCPVSPVDSPNGDNGAAVRAKGIYAHLSEEDRIKKEQDMDAWRMEQFKRRDEERRLKEEALRKKREEERAAAKLKQQKEEIAKKQNGKAKKVTGYQLFAAEKRDQLQKADPSMATTAITKVCKVSWETCHKTIKKQYETKAKQVRDSARLLPSPFTFRVRTLSCCAPQQNKAERDRVNADKKKARALQAKLDKEEKARQAAAAAEEGDGGDEIEWIMCEQCRKWRVIPPEVAKVLDSSQAAAWTCSMNTWDEPPPEGTSPCDVPQQSMEDEDDDEDDAEGAAMDWPPEKFEVGMPCDAKDEYGNFYKAKIVAVDSAEQTVKVHYNGEFLYWA